MTDIAPTAANVKASSNTTVVRVQYGEAVDQGEVVYLKSDDKYWLAYNANSTVAAVKGVALTPNVADGWGIIATAGDIDIGDTLAIGTIYTVSSTAGAIHPEADLATTELVSVVGFGKTAALLTLSIQATGIAHA